MLLVWSVPVLMAGLLLAVAGRRVERTLPERHVRRVAIRSRFARFAAANRIAPSSDVEIARFWHDTRDAHAVFSSGAAQPLRNDLRDGAARLSALQEVLASEALGVDRRACLMRERQDVLDGLGDHVRRIDALLASESGPRPTRGEFWREVLRQFGRQLRA